MIPKERLTGWNQSYFIVVADDSEEGPRVRDNFYCATREPSEYRTARGVVLRSKKITSAIGVVQNTFGPVGMRWLEEVIKGNAACFHDILRRVVIYEEMRNEHPEIKNFGFSPNRFGS